jgi:acyl CoA:acetate/3-ketoacid CoA transferase beta subunit
MAEVLPLTDPGVRVERVLAQTGWELEVRDELAQTEPPTDKESAALRELLSR